MWNEFGSKWWAIEHKHLTASSLRGTMISTLRWTNCCYLMFMQRLKMKTKIPSHNPNPSLFCLCVFLCVWCLSARLYLTAPNYIFMALWVFLRDASWLHLACPLSPRHFTLPVWSRRVHSLCSVSNTFSQSITFVVLHVVKQTQFVMMNSEYFQGLSHLRCRHQ